MLGGIHCWLAQPASRLTNARLNHFGQRRKGVTAIESFDDFFSFVFAGDNDDGDFVLHAIAGLTQLFELPVVVCSHLFFCDGVLLQVGGQQHFYEEVFSYLFELQLSLWRFVEADLLSVLSQQLTIDEFFFDGLS